ncbi:MAG: hypothetical protein D3923_19120, partial [Candidatus Electrothrix sp. AR3]|nr:hypothetical protein [Candidatus Electrothrix sp. AR3]
MPTEREKNMLLLGDSLLEWGDWEVLLPEFQVVNRGVSGEHVEDLSARLIQEIDALPEPDYILIMSGTNNLVMGNPHFPAIFASMLPRLADFCPKSSISLNSIMPMRIQGLAEEKINAVNLELQTIAQRSGCRFLDMTQPFTEQCLPITKPCFLNDGVHLDTRGYQIWAKEIRSH